MKNTAVLIKGAPVFGADEKCFDGNSALDLSVSFMKKITGNDPVVLSCEDGKYLSNFQVLSQMVQVCEKGGFENIVTGFADCPFYCESVTKELIDLHEKFGAEYTYADGYPYGLVPEILNVGTARIICRLLETSASALKDKPFAKESLFEIIKTDINSFEVECLISGFDYRLWRYDFSCTNKRSFLACKKLWEFGIKDVLGEGKTTEDLEKILDKTISEPSILKTVPAYYNLQISSKVNQNPVYSPYEKLTLEKWGKKPFECSNYMSLESLSSLADEMIQVSDTAVVNLSMWGEPLCNPQFLEIVETLLSKKGLSVFIETDGLLWTDEIIENLLRIVKAAPEGNREEDKIMISVCLDAFTADMYKKIRGGSETDFAKAVETLNKLCKAFSDENGCSVYPQYVRMKENEGELENFYRYWSNKENESCGNVIIQKYDSFAGFLPDSKPADLSPVERNVCWHLRRDMNVLCDGEVPLCRTFLNESLGNVFQEGIESLWKKYDHELASHIKENYCKICGKCDEYYTFNF